MRAWVYDEEWGGAAERKPLSENCKLYIYKNFKYMYVNIAGSTFVAEKM